MSTEPIVFLQRITKPLAWTQLIVSVGIIATVIYGQFKLHDTWAANSPLLESTKSSLQHAQESLAQANKTLPGIKEGVPTLEAALRTVNVALMTTADVMDKLSNNMRFSAPTSIEMQGIKPVFVMTRPLEPSANDVKAQANVIRATGNSLQNTADSVHTLPAVLSEISETMAASQTAIGQLEPMIGQIMILMNWGSLIALLIATWCFLNSLSTLALAHKKPTATNLSGVI